MPIPITEITSSGRIEEQHRISRKTQQTIFASDKESIEIMENRKEAEWKELDTTLGEIALISCPIPNCPTHTKEKIQSVTGVTNLGTKNSETVIKPNIKIKDKNNIKDKEDNKNPKPSNKRTGQEDFKAPTKFARKCIEIPIEKVICTSSNKFAVLDNEEIMDVTPPKPRIKPIMLRTNKNYNLILQEIYRTYPETLNKNTGNYIKIQPASEEDHENIKKLLITKKADHYVIEEPKIIKTVIKGLPASTDDADIESELKDKGIAVEKVTQLRRFATKALLPLFMVEVKRSAEAEKIYELKNVICLTVEVVPYPKFTIKLSASSIERRANQRPHLARDEVSDWLQSVEKIVEHRDPFKK
ncbi:uncharacterized protein TNCV_2749061 [Trichonephila clavipes]|nr:uncharacterized protein TNCV_2749061 [Trichonephila clavipes]